MALAAGGVATGLLYCNSEPSSSSACRASTFGKSPFRTFLNSSLRSQCVLANSCASSSGKHRGAISAVQVVASVVEDDEEEEFEDEAEELPVEVYEKVAKGVVEEYSRDLYEQMRREDAGLKGKAKKGKKRGGKEVYDSELRIPDHLLPKVAIVGRPNVGKSALFNRIAGGDIAIVHDEAGVTRDRLYTRAFWSTHEFMLVDTGGVLTIPGDGSDAVAVTSGGGAEAVERAVKEAFDAGLPAMIERQAGAAVESADSIIFVVDGQTGLTAADIDIGNWLRKKHSDKKITLAVNKCESPTKGQLQAAEFWTLGFTPIPVSAISGTGTGDLLDLVCEDLKPAEGEMEEEEDQPMAIAIVGKPNVGKSSILNALVGEERTIVSPVSGTTRDAIDTDFVDDSGTQMKLIDTAGIRRRGAVAAAGSRTESLSVNRAFRAIRRADVVALVIDAMDCVTEQDFRLGERIAREGKACIIVVNKWDTVPNKDATSTVWYDRDVRERLRCLDWAPTVYCSASSGQRIRKILEAAVAAGEERCRRLTTATLNQVIRDAVALKQPPTGRGGKKGRIYYCTQAGIKPPTFVFFVNDANLFPEIYRRYMEKQLRLNVGYPGTPVRLLWRSKLKTDRKDGPNRDASSRSSSSSGKESSPSLANMVPFSQ
ncbi:hypothetical protein M758_3G127500 [Ceratodon purpureus]|uniref:GTPase Der n=1 Tax=Ceratodon purpureus TaxID=3225 RepID=A0A8T0IK88_CERPU|nr:hypothetical protein KC19_3G125900 [Ceratodon purpureus]KAG0622838.1 hypothetical protein M758_3G127500 [Ceratodon purpureus]